MMRPLLLLSVLVMASSTWAQSLPDSGLPDASVDSGGADQNQEENEMPNGLCIDTRGCERGFECVQGRCVPGPNALRSDRGCSTTGAWPMLAGLAVVLAGGARRLGARPATRR